MITARTTRENPTQGNTFLIWRGGTVRDFELSVKFLIVGGNSGIQYRSKDLGNWRVGGYQADFEAGDRFTGIVYEERGRGILGNVGEKATVGRTGSPGRPVRWATRKSCWHPSGKSSGTNMSSRRSETTWSTPSMAG